MRKKISLLLAVVIWLSVIVQLVLMIENRTASVLETFVRFVSFFTILTNTLAALYFTVQSLHAKQYNKAGTLTAVTVYITIVGLVYQVLLRHLWQPTGMQRIIDELLHTINPLLVVLYWYVYEDKATVKYGQIKSWLIYPLAYLIFILIRGSLSGFYPYPFVDMKSIGLAKTAVNSSLLLVFFAFLSYLFIAVGKRLVKTRIQSR